MKISMTITGGPELASRLNALSTRVGRSVARRALENGAEPMVASIDAKAPRSPKTPPAVSIAGNIVVGNARPPSGDVGIAVGPKRSLRHAGFLEFGTKRTAAQPYIRPGFDATVPTTLQRITNALWASLRSQTGGANVGSRNL